MDPDRDRNGFYELRRTYSKLYQRVHYLTNIPVVINRIVEYDIRSGNTSVLRRAQVIKKSTLDSLEALPGKDRKVLVGKIIRDEKWLQKVIANGFIRAKRDLFQANSIQDNEVLSIKNDAVYIIGRRLKKTTFGPIEFRPKGVYAMYMNLERLELYYDQKNDTVDVKGIRDDVVLDPDHQEGMVRFLATVMRYLVYDRRDALRKYLVEFSSQYKRKELPVQYYKEFNSLNIYRTTMDLGEYTINLSTAGEGDKPDINGVYNYKRFVLPLIQLYL